MKINKSLFKAMRAATRVMQTAGARQAGTALQRALRGQMPKPPSADDYRAAVDALRNFKPPAGADPFCMFSPPAPAPGPAPTAPDERVHHGHFVCEAGGRDYQVHIPRAYTGQALPLVVMLHGCTQNADDFALGTQMSALADARDCFVAYPIQRRQDNVSKCWNWFQPRDQQRGNGEPAVIAGLTEEIVSHYNLDRRRIFIAGLSAGGAMAVIMAATYPDLYAAVGVHSGLDIGIALDVASALSAMKGHPSGAPALRPPGVIPLILFQGDADTTVHPRNAEQIMARFTRADEHVDVVQGGAPGGHTYTRKIFQGQHGKPDAEQWTVHGSGHAWSGGSQSGSYTDPKGPNASQEMLRFFFEHPKPA